MVMLKGELIGGNELVGRFKRINPAIQESLNESVQRLTLKLMKKVKQDKLSGQALNVKTGRLRRSVNRRFEQSATVVSGFVGTNVEYAARQEYGFTGTETVREHMRMMKVAFGRPVKDPHQVLVKQHSRRVNYPAHSFLRSALADMDAEIKESIASAVQQKVNEVFR